MDKKKPIDPFNPIVIAYLTGENKWKTREGQAADLQAMGFTSRSGRPLSGSHISNLGKINPALRVQPKYQKPNYAGRNHVVCKQEKKIRDNLQLKTAVSTLIDNLKHDEGYRITWKANIAMSYVDEFRRQTENAPFKLEYTFLHKVANEAAENFIQLLTR